MGESLESNATLIKKMEEQELQAREKSGKKSVKASGKNKIKAAIPEKSSFVQKLPRVKNSRKFWQVWKRDEDDDVNELKKTFKSADLCTLRESDSMRKYLERGGYQEAAGYRHLYTNLFTGLSYDKRLEFAERCELAGELKRVLDSHMLRHGIRNLAKKDFCRFLTGSFSLIRIPSILFHLSRVPVWRNRRHGIITTF
ncbi:MAG: hypothetical protein K6E91_14605 [Butyrivibrio sp.]|nr:hypothetical protein [Butyrivibrio sp.]